MDLDLADFFEAFARELAALPNGSAPAALVERTAAACREALVAAAGRPDDLRWSRLYGAAERLVAALEDAAALPGLRAFLRENTDLRDGATELTPA
jgi:hypothetical protein